MCLLRYEVFVHRTFALAARSMSQQVLHLTHHNYRETLKQSIHLFNKKIPVHANVCDEPGSF